MFGSDKQVCIIQSHWVSLSFGPLFLNGGHGMVFKKGECLFKAAAISYRGILFTQKLKCTLVFINIHHFTNVQF